MDIFENEKPDTGLDNTSDVEQQVEVKPKKQSPFADSPYMMNHDSTYHYVDTQSVTPPKAKKSSGKLWRRIVAAVLVAVLIAGGVFAAIIIKKKRSSPN